MICLEGNAKPTAREIPSTTSERAAYIITFSLCAKSFSHVGLNIANSLTGGEPDWHCVQVLQSERRPRISSTKSDGVATKNMSVKNREWKSALCIASCKNGCIFMPTDWNSVRIFLKLMPDKSGNLRP